MFDFSYHMDFGAVLPAIASVSVILLISGKIYKRIRVRFPVKVNCWFCNGSASVPYDGSDSWYCPHCDQYNGFNADGGYNRPLVEQYSERLNCASFAVRTSAAPPAAASNGLCRFCNVNLQLKVRQLAQFVPLRPDDYDREVQQYSDRLERVYRLCGRCDAVLAKTLREKEKLVVGRGPSAALIATATTAHSPPPLWRLRVALATCALAAAVLPLSDWAEHLRLALPPHLLLTTPPPALARLLAAAAHYVDRRYLLVVACLCQTASLLLAPRRDGPPLLVGLLVWCALLALDWFPLPLLHADTHNSYATVVQASTAVFLLLLAVIRGRQQRPRTVAAVKPVRLHKLSPDSTGLASSADKTCRLAAATPERPAPSSPATEPDLGLGRLSVGAGVGRPVTRSQTRGHTFEARHYTSKGGGSHQLFKGLTPATLPPPPDTPLTRSSSLSSGFVSQPPSPSPSPPPSAVDHDTLDSVSRCDLDLLPYSRLHGFPPISRSPSPAFTVMHVTPPPAFGKFYAEMLYYENSVDRSPYKHEPSFLQKVQAFLTPVLFTVLIASNSLVLWTLFGEQYFKTKS